MKGPLIDVETDMQMVFANWRVDTHSHSGFHAYLVAPCLVLGIDFPGYPWAAVCSGMSLSFTEMLLLEYWKGLSAPERMTVII